MVRTSRSSKSEKTENDNDIDATGSDFIKSYFINDMTWWSERWCARIKWGENMFNDEIHSNKNKCRYFRCRAVTIDTGVGIWMHMFVFVDSNRLCKNESWLFFSSIWFEKVRREKWSMQCVVVFFKTISYNKSRSRKRENE